MIRLQCFDLCPSFGQSSNSGIIVWPAIVELFRDLLHFKLVRVDREDLGTGQFRVVLPREEEVLDGHVVPSEVWVLNFDLEIFALFFFLQTIAQQPVVPIDLLVLVLCVLWLWLTEFFHQIFHLLLILSFLCLDGTLDELNNFLALVFVGWPRILL